MDLYVEEQLRTTDLPGAGLFGGRFRDAASRNRTSIHWLIPLAYHMLIEWTILRGGRAIFSSKSDDTGLVGEEAARPRLLEGLRPRRHSVFRDAPSRIGRAWDYGESVAVPRAASELWINEIGPGWRAQVRKPCREALIRMSFRVAGLSRADRAQFPDGGSFIGSEFAPEEAGDVNRRRNENEETHETPGKTIAQNAPVTRLRLHSVVGFDAAYNQK